MSNLQQAIVKFILNVLRSAAALEREKRTKKEGPEGDIEIAHIQLETVWELDNESLRLMSFGWGRR